MHAARDNTDGSSRGSGGDGGDARNLPVRDRLLGRFVGSIVIVRGPSGFGKTVLLDQWARAAPSTAQVRVQLGEDLRTAREFWRAVLSGLSSVHGLDPDGPVAAQLAHLDEHDPDPGALAAALRGVPETAVLVDRFERAHDSDAIARGMGTIARAAPSLRFVIATRRTTAVEKPEYRASVDVTVLEPDDLRFTVGEIEHELAAAGLSYEGLALLVRDATRGVAHLVRFAALELRRLPPEQLELVRPGLEQRVRSYVASLLSGSPIDPDFPDLSGDSLRTLASASFIDEVLAAELTGVDGHLVLEDLEAAGLGLRGACVRGDGTFLDGFRFTEMVGHALREDAHAQDPDRHLENRRLFAHWARAHGLPLEAFAASLDSASFDLASEIVLDHWFELGTLHRDAVTGPLERLDRRTLTRWPLLAGQLALCHIGERDRQWRSAELFGIALVGIALRRKSAPPLERFMYALLEMIAARAVLGSYSRARALALRLGEMFHELRVEDIERAAALMPHAIAHIAATLLFSGDTDAALVTLLSSTTTVQQAVALPRSQYFAVSLRAGAHAIAGEMSDADRIRRQSDAIAGQRQLHAADSGSPARLAEAYVHLEEGRFDEAHAVMRRLHPRYDTIESIHLLLEAEAWAMIGRGDAEGCFIWVSEARSRAQRQRTIPSFVTAHIDRTLARAALAGGRFALANRLARGTTKLDPASHALIVAQTLLGQNHVAEALPLLIRHRPSGRSTWRTSLEHGLALSLALVRSSDADAATTELKAVTASLLRHRLTLPLLAQRTWGMQELVTLAQERGLDDFVSLARPFTAEAVVMRSIPKLTPRERQVLERLAQTPSYTEIAQTFLVSINTVRSQVRSLYKKLDVTSREEAIAVAAALHLVEGERHAPQLQD